MENEDKNNVKYEDLPPKTREAIDAADAIGQAMLDGLNAAKAAGKDIY